MRSKSIIFICTGNTYRSVLAKNALKNYISTQTTDSWVVDSAGIVARPDSVRQCIVDFLKEKGIEINHKQTKLECHMLSDYDYVIAMAENHLRFMEEECNFQKTKLFNELAVGEKSSIWDVEDNVPDASTNEKAVCSEVERTAEHIFKHIPSVFESIKNESVSQD